MKWVVRKKTIQSFQSSTKSYIKIIPTCLSNKTENEFYEVENTELATFVEQNYKPKIFFIQLLTINRGHKQRFIFKDAKIVDADLVTYRKDEEMPTI